jgi:hypothetical protein
VLDLYKYRTTLKAMNFGSSAERGLTETERRAKSEMRNFLTLFSSSGRIKKWDM